VILIAWDLPPFCRVCGARGYADNHARHRNRCDGSRGRAAEMTMHDQTRALLPRCWKRAIASWSSSTNFAPSSIGIAAAKPRTLALPHRAQHRHGFSQTIRAKKHGACSRRSGAPRVSTTSVYCDRRPFLANRVTHARNQSSASRHFCDAQTTRQWSASVIISCAALPGYSEYTALRSFMTCSSAMW